MQNDENVPTTADSASPGETFAPPIQPGQQVTASEDGQKPSTPPAAATAPTQSEMNKKTQPPTPQSTLTLTQPNIGDVQQPTVSPSLTPLPPDKAKNKKWLVFGGSLGGLLVLGALFFFFMYLPNTPGNVYRRGMASVGVGLQEMIDNDELFKAKATEFEGELTIEEPFELTASLSGSAAQSGDGSYDFNVGWDKYDITFNLFFSLLKSEYPEFYFRVNGVKELADDYFGEGYLDQAFNGRQLENVWWHVDFQDLAKGGYISQEQLDEFANETRDQATYPSSEDYQALAKAVIEASNEYIFTSDSDKMVLQRTEDLGVEEFEGVESRRYLAEVNKENLKAYVKLARDKIIDSGVISKLYPDYSEEDLRKDLKDSDIDDWADDLDMSDVRIEVWVGLNNKVLRNVRFIPDESPKSYVELSLLLDDKDFNKIPLRFRINTDEDEQSGVVDLTSTLDMSNSSTTISMTGDLKDESLYGSNYKWDAYLNITDLSEEPAYEIPTPSQSFFDLIFQDLYGNPYEDVLGITSLVN